MCDVSASQIRKKEDLQTQYKSKVSRLQAELDELRQRSITGEVDDQQQQSAASTQPPPLSQLRLYIASIERHEDRHMKVISKKVNK